MVTGPFYVKRIEKHKGPDRPTDHFGVFCDGWDKEDTQWNIKDRKPSMVTAFGGKGSRESADLMCKNLNLSWEAFHSGYNVNIDTDEAVGLRDLKDIAQEAIDIQNASNLSGVIHAWSRSISDLWKHFPDESTVRINTYWTNQLFAAKVVDLAGPFNDNGFAFAYEECKRLAGHEVSEQHKALTE